MQPLYVIATVLCHAEGEAQSVKSATQKVIQVGCSFCFSKSNLTIIQLEQYIAVISLSRAHMNAMVKGEVLDNTEI